jgi:hypothetical protein
LSTSVGFERLHEPLLALSPARLAEVVSELNLTPLQRQQIRTIQEEAIFGWLKGPRPGKPAGAPEKSTNERLLAVLTEEQVRRWRSLTGEPVRFAIVPFGVPDARTPP